MFKIGDVVEGICDYSDPYTITCRGWVGIIIAINELEIQVSPFYSSTNIDKFVVDSKYFKLRIRKFRRNLPEWW